MTEALTVTTLNNQIKSLLESHYTALWVKGEVSRVTYHTSGHLYFSLKDENSTISCVMFKGNNRSLKFRVEEGMSVLCFGGLSVFTPRGSYQLNIMTIEPEGSGALSLAYEQLKKRLQEKGYFDEALKKPLPPYPKTIALVTSKTGAALQDMLRVAKKRYPLVKFILLDTLVQGEGSADMIAKNITKADGLKCDIIIVARGGGSQEDLWSFNEEIVADAIYKAKTPVISAIGHEIDHLISDFVADKRASTPSNAIELALPDKTELLLTLDNLQDSFVELITTKLYKKRVELKHIEELFKQNSYEQKLQNQKEILKSLNENFLNSIKLKLSQKRAFLENLKENYKQNDPSLHDKKGFAQIVKDGKKVDIDELNVDDIFKVLSSKKSLEAKVVSQ
jgi:exodeoxyribonuclease VII large subunit